MSYHDPHVPAFDLDGLAMTSVDDLDQALQEMDCAINVTDHTWYQWDEIHKSTKVIVDTRNVF